MQGAEQVGKRNNTYVLHQTPNKTRGGCGPHVSILHIPFPVPISCHVTCHVILMSRHPPHPYSLPPSLSSTVTITTPPPPPHSLSLSLPVGLCPSQIRIRYSVGMQCVIMTCSPPSPPYSDFPLLPH